MPFLSKLNEKSVISVSHGGKYEESSGIYGSDCGGSTYLWNVGLLQRDYTAISQKAIILNFTYSRRQTPGKGINTQSTAWLQTQDTRQKETPPNRQP
jgi:hypothetical protein